MNKIPKKIKYLNFGISLLIFLILNSGFILFNNLWSGLERIFDYHIALSTNPLDYLVFASIPIFGMVLNSKRPSYKATDLIIDNLKILLSVLLTFGIGFYLLTIFSKPTNPLIPQNLLIEPFNAYSVLIIGVGILIPFLFTKRNNMLADTQNMLADTQNVNNIN